LEVLAVIAMRLAITSTVIYDFLEMVERSIRDWNSAQEEAVFEVIMLQIKKHLSYIVLFFSVYAMCVNGQSRDSVTADNCELTLSKLDGVYQSFKQRDNRKSILFVEGGRASKEANKYNLRRLNDALRYFRIKDDLKDSEILTVNSRKTLPLGFFRFYVDGELIEEIWFRRNASLCLDTGA
jgi:hypothetical protein